MVEVKEQIRTQVASVEIGARQWICSLDDVAEYRQALSEWGYATQVDLTWEDENGKWARIVAIWPAM